MNNQPTVLNFDYSQIDPNWSGGAFLPVSDAKGWLVILTGDNGFKPTKSGEGYYLELVGIGQDQPVAGMEFVLRLNLQHNSQQAVTAANSQLSALGHVTGCNGVVRVTSDLFNKPFRIVSVKQNNGDYTQLANNGILDANGNPPGKASGPQTTMHQQNNPPQPPQNNNGGNFQQQNNGGGNWNTGQQQQQQNFQQNNGGVQQGNFQQNNPPNNMQGNQGAPFNGGQGNFQQQNNPPQQFQQNNGGGGQPSWTQTPGK
jgi:hypothetical protein